MDEGKHWRLRACEMRELAARTKDPFISRSFLALAEQYERLAEDGARWLSAAAGLTLAGTRAEARRDCIRTTSSDQGSPQVLSA